MKIDNGRAAIANQSSVVVIGSGFHRWIRSGVAEDPLSSWSELLREIAREVRVAIPSHVGPTMTLAWEQLLLRMVREGYVRPVSKSPLAEPLSRRISKVDADARRAAKMVREGYVRPVGKSQLAEPWSRRVSQVEADARRAAKIVLKRADDQKIHEWGRAREFRQLPVTDVVSLNFDLTWIDSTPVQFYTPALAAPKEGANPLPNTELERLYSRITIPENKNVWFPNGAVHPRGPEIRLGLRDFGLQMNALQHGFQMFKAWESRMTKSKTEPMSTSNYMTLLEKLDIGAKGDLQDADHWVTRFMMRPVYILGAGLSPEEQGLWWLLAQRARNLARVDGAAPARILLNASTMTTEERLTWNRKAPIIEPIWCEDFDHGWQNVFRRIQRHAARTEPHAMAHAMAHAME